MNTMGFLFKII